MGEANVDVMGFFDHTAFAFCACVVAMATVGEMKEIWLARFAVQTANDRIQTSYRWILAFLFGMRRWAVIPTLVGTIPMLVYTQGADALTVCFNSVAVLAPVNL